MPRGRGVRDAAASKSSSVTRKVYSSKSNGGLASAGDAPPGRRWPSVRSPARRWRRRPTIRSSTSGEETSGLNTSGSRTTREAKTGTGWARCSTPGRASLATIRAGSAAAAPAEHDVDLLVLIPPKSTSGDQGATFAKQIAQIHPGLVGGGRVSPSITLHKSGTHPAYEKWRIVLVDAGRSTARGLDSRADRVAGGQAQHAGLVRRGPDRLDSARGIERSRAAAGSPGRRRERTRGAGQQRRHRQVRLARPDRVLAGLRPRSLRERVGLAQCPATISRSIHWLPIGRRRGRISTTRNATNWRRTWPVCPLRGSACRRTRRRTHCGRPATRLSTASAAPTATCGSSARSAASTATSCCTTWDPNWPIGRGPTSARYRLVERIGSLLRRLDRRVRRRPAETLRQWRTPPLWGVANSAPYLHDGRAWTLEQAILEHRGEGEVAMRRYQKLILEGRARLLAFLGSLGPEKH